MKRIKSISNFSNYLIIVLLLFANCLHAQTHEYTSQNDSSILPHRAATSKLNFKRLLVPAFLINIGATGMSIPIIKELNLSTRAEITEDHYKKSMLDNYTQYVPGALVFGLNALGIKSAHNLRERTIIYGTSILITTAIVTPLKHWAKEERPDHSNNLSFPSGHTATAFANAQFMFREYKHSNILLSLAGYPFAIFTGTYRVINNRHWVSDVIAGAGIGILSTELAYWLAPKIDHLLFRKNQKQTLMVSPYYQSNSIGLGLTSTF